MRFIKNKTSMGLALVPLIALVFVAALPQQGQQIGFVNSEAILQQMPGFAAADSTFQGESSVWQDEMDRLQAVLDSAVRDYDSLSVTYTEEQRQQKMDELQQMSGQVQQRNSELSQQAQNRWLELVAPLQDRGRAVIDGVRAERGLALVLEVTTPGIVAIDPELDLTEVVLARLGGSE